MAWQWFTGMFMHNQMDGRRSSALTPLLLLIALLVALISVLAASRYSPIWAMATLVCLVVVVVGSILVAYFLFAVRNPDLLRSEHYSLSKLAIQQGIKGDSFSGAADGDRPELPPVMLDPVSAPTGRRLSGAKQ